MDQGGMPWMPLPLATQAKQPQHIFNWMPWINWNRHESNPHTNCCFPHPFPISWSHEGDNFLNLFRTFAETEKSVFWNQGGPKTNCFPTQSNHVQKILRRPQKFWWIVMGPSVEIGSSSQTASDHRAKPTWRRFQEVKGQSRIQTD